MNAEVNTALDISKIISTTQPSKRAHGSKVERLNEGWKEKKVEELKREGVWGEGHDAEWRMNTMVLRGWHNAIHSAPVPKRACRQGGITEERGGEIDNERKERHHPPANSPNEMFLSIKKLELFEDLSASSSAWQLCEYANLSVKRIAIN